MKNEKAKKLLKKANDFRKEGVYGTIRNGIESRNKHDGMNRKKSRKKK